MGMERSQGRTGLCGMKIEKKSHLNNLDRILVIQVRLFCVFVRFKILSGVPYTNSGMCKCCLKLK